MAIPRNPSGKRGWVRSAAMVGNGGATRRVRDPRRLRVLSLANVRWIVTHRAYTPWYLGCYLRLLRIHLTRPDVVLTGLALIGRGVEIYARPGYGRVILGRWVHIGEGSRLRAHEGTLTVGDKVVIGRDSTINCHLDVEIGDATLISDWVYIADFDHVTTDTAIAIKDQGIVKTPVRIGPGSWLGVKTTVLRGTTIGAGCVLAAHSVARGPYPDYTIIAGVPGRVVRERAEPPAERGTEPRTGSATLDGGPDQPQGG